LQAPWFASTLTRGCTATWRRIMVLAPFIVLMSTLAISGGNGTSSNSNSNSKSNSCRPVTARARAQTTTSVSTFTISAKGLKEVKWLVQVDTCRQAFHVNNRCRGRCRCRAALHCRCRLFSCPGSCWRTRAKTSAEAESEPKTLQANLSAQKDTNNGS
jgi:hypothetical protein